MLLIAATYGLARFGVGLFAPALAEARPQLVAVLGWASAAQFASYALATTVAARLVDRRPRLGLVLAGLTATVGCLGVASAQEPVMFVLAVLVAGTGGGFASPALVPIIDAVAAPRMTATAQAVVNTGTSVGVVAVGLLSFSIAAPEQAWTIMAAACAAIGVLAWASTRRHPEPAGRSAAGRPSQENTARENTARENTARENTSRSWRALAAPAAAAVTVGAGSSLLWTFGPLIVTDAGLTGPDAVGWLWIALGLGGSLGSATGALVTRVGLRSAWCIGAVGVAAASVALGVAAVMGTGWLAPAAMGVFGAGYIGLSGVLILWGRHAWPGTPGAATSVLFNALATGQALGAAGFGLLLAPFGTAAGPLAVAGVAAALSVAGGLLPALVGRIAASRRRPATAQPFSPAG
ncbi:hypothetical protein BGP79_02110 [Tersicoccus sp. Bi-70]|nr:hypothetical protein BGP79_02110 [Tersicoccus sp. Bi-70]